MSRFFEGALSALSKLRGQAPAMPVVRRIGRERAADCAALHALSFAHPWTVAELEQLLGAKESLADGALDGKGQMLFGFVLSRKAADEAEILTIAVDPAHRKAGIGAKLLAAHLAKLAAARAKTLFLEVDQNNAAARALYARFGFRQVGERKAYYRTADGGRATALVMRLDLDERLSSRERHDSRSNSKPSS
jgi:[ribosomal protein S18]-alanine N-acetyltransferase